MSTTLTFLHLRFHLVAEERIALNGFMAGHYLRGALGNRMLTAFCPENPRREKPTPEHAAVCPACWLLAAETAPGEVRRAYALRPPLPPLERVEPGQAFSFGLTLFGDGARFLPYFVLAVPAMGRQGVGPGRRRFRLHAIEAWNPFTQETTPVMLPGSTLIHPPEEVSGWEGAQQAAFHMAASLGGQGDLQMRFRTPTRLVDSKKLMKTPDFGVFFRRLLERIDHLEQQYCGAGRRPEAEMRSLYALADRVRLVDASHIRWVDLFGRSGRTRRQEPLGGFVGRAVFRAEDWSPLLPYLLLGGAVQVGRHTVRGNGVVEVSGGSHANHSTSRR